MVDALHGRPQGAPVKSPVFPPPLAQLSFLLTAVGLALLPLGCSSTPGPGPHPGPGGPDGPSDPGQCRVEGEREKPLTVEWPSAERGALETAARTGTVVVRYDGCEIELLTRCKTPGLYRFRGFSPKQDQLSIKTVDDLHAKLPIAGARFEARVGQGSELGVDMMLVGRYDLERSEVGKGELVGQCDGATHVVGGMTIGAYELYSAASAEAGGGMQVADVGLGGGSKASKETLTQDGKVAACATATPQSNAPPEDCAAIIRIEVIPLTSGVTDAVAKDMVQVPAGDFPMGCPRALSKPDPSPTEQSLYCMDHEQPNHTIYLDACRIDRTEVTVAQYGKCVEAGRCNTEGLTEMAPDDDEPDYAKKERLADSAKYCNWGKSDRSNHPINCVTSLQAKAYCEWRGKRLPTEAEWEKAARGTDDRFFPWGNQPATCDRAVMSESCTPEKCETDRAQYGCGRQSTWPVGSKPAGASPYGALDMAGNVFEWVSDPLDEQYYAMSPRKNPTGGKDQLRVYRGGAFTGNRHDQKAFLRDGTSPDFGDFVVGFRCVLPSR